jgi:hypothetical protein
MHAGHLEHDPAIVDQDLVAGTDISGKPRVCGAHLGRVTWDILAGNGELVTRRQVHRTRREGAEPNLRTLQIDEHPDTPSGLVAGRANGLVSLQVVIMRAMAHVEPRDV